MPGKKNLTVIIIVTLLLLVLAVPYFYNKLVHAPRHEAPADTQY